MNKYRKSKLANLLLIAVITVLCCSCQASPSVSEITGVDRWYHYNPVTNENEVLVLDEENFFSYNCECGEPVGNADLYDQYKYDQKNQTLTAYCEGEESTLDFSVVDMSPYHLILKNDQEIKVFSPWQINDEFSYFGEEKYISNYSGYFTVKSLENGSATLTTFNYDGDVDYEESAFLTYTLASNAKFYDLAVDTTIKDNQADNNVTYKELSMAEVDKLFKDNNSPSAFIWFNDNMEIEKAVFYGQIINWV